MPRLSLCLIAKDEEAFLPRCLASAREVVDEIVLVDTGSRDGTARIAREAGARVLSVPWTDDFSAARNASLEAASGTHLLVLDCDEQLAPQAGPALRRALEDPRLALGFLPLHDALALDSLPQDVLSGASRLAPPVHVPRLVRNDPRLRFRRRVHETWPRQLARVLAELDGEARAVAAPIVHYGEVPEVRARRAKGERNRRLLELALAEDPADHDLAGYLALERARAGDKRGAEALAAEHLPALVAELARTVRPGEPHDSPVPLARVCASLRLERGDARGALQAVRSALPFADEHPDLVFLEAAALERAGELAEAERGFRRALALDGRATSVPVSQGVTGESARLRLANVLLARGEAAEALPLLAGVGARLALAAQLACAEAELALERPEQALRRLAPLLARPAPPPDLFALAAGASARLGAPDPVFADAARARSAHEWLEPRRRALLG